MALAAFRKVKTKKWVRKLKNINIFDLSFFYFNTEEAVLKTLLYIEHLGHQRHHIDNVSSTG